ncbi:MAG: heavy-metal-associated domain-containing protein [Legionella sp.]|nr:heavy-metal-associated domain-containing protein [Legionella sp.]
MKFTYSIEGMHCSSCIEKIKAALSSHVKLIDISLNPPLLQIEADKTPLLNELNTHIATAGKYRLQLVLDATGASPEEEKATGFRAYFPIFLIAAYIIGVASLNNFHAEGADWHRWMNQFMAGFFLVFSAFKFLDIRGFADGYATYDLLAKRWYYYGFIYPFLELSLGILYLQEWLPFATQLLTIVIMGFSSLGVINSMLKKQKLKCACLGTILNVPLSSITLIEDLTMVGLAALALVIT